MSDLPFFEFLVYFVPGIFTGVGVFMALLRASIINASMLSSNQALLSVCLVAFVLAAGLTTHVLGTYLVILLYKFTAVSPVWEVTQLFRDTGAHAVIRSRIESVVGVAPTDDIDLYRYCQHYLASEGGGLWARVERLQGLSLLCRNLLISLTVFGLGAYYYFEMWRLGFVRNALVALGGGALVTILLKGTLNYSSAAVYAVYRGVLISTGPG